MRRLPIVLLIALLIASCASDDAERAPGPKASTASLDAAPHPYAVEVPPEDQCPPYPVVPGNEEEKVGDAPPRILSEGMTIGSEDLTQIKQYLPPAVWQRRESFFYEGMAIRVGPCHRRYPVPDAVREATVLNDGRARIEDGSLIDYAGIGLPFDPAQIDMRSPDAAARWAWDYRYRYMGTGFRGAFRIIHILKRGRKTERFEGDSFLYNHAGYPGGAPDARDELFWAGGSFTKPAISRGIAWRQMRKLDADRDSDRADDIWVWLPDLRKAKRAPPSYIDGIFMPSYTRGQQAGGGTFQMPDGSGGGIDFQSGTLEHFRRGYVGLMIRPNAYRFHFLRVQDVLAPINSDLLGYPLNANLSWGPSGISVASGVWDLRRAVVLRGNRKNTHDGIGNITLYIDALTQAPLYYISRRTNDFVKEVGIFVGRFNGTDPVAPKWEGGGDGVGAVLPVAQVFFVAGEGGWIRESFELRSDPPTPKELRSLTSPIGLQRGR